MALQRKVRRWLSLGAFSLWVSDHLSGYELTYQGISERQQFSRD